MNPAVTSDLLSASVWSSDTVATPRFLTEREFGKDCLTILIRGARCPLRCRMCDLHRDMIDDGPTPPGSVPVQVRTAMSDRPSPDIVKLYNAGSFFDPRAVPPADHAAIAEEVAGVERVVVENHPRFGSSLAIDRFARSIGGRLEIAVGLETVRPGGLRFLDKRFDRDDFDRFANFLRRADIDLRTFVIVGWPGDDITESIRWARATVRHAAAAGSRVATLIPARAGEGWGGRADQLPAIDAGVLENAAGVCDDDLHRSGSACRVAVDTWDLTDGPVKRRLIERQAEAPPGRGG